jgi:hypothetical protein
MSGTTTGAIRIALTYFSAAPLQRWTGGIGVTLILVALAMRAVSRDTFIIVPSVLLLALGIILIVLVPAMLGGGMMRAASTRTILHHRPWGRQRMVLGATLAITLVALCAPLLDTAMSELPSQRSGRRPVLEVLAFAWSFVAITWVCVFIATGNRLLSVSIGFLPLAIAKFGETIFGELPAWLLVVMSVILWACFSLWYLQAPQIRQLVYSKTRQVEVYDNAFNRFFQWVAGADRGVSRARAMDAYLLGLSPKASLAMGVYFVVGAAIMHFIFHIYTGDSKNAALQLLTPMFFLPVILLTWGVLGYAFSRRIRVLWLRAGMDRSRLFREAERSGLLVGLLGFGIFLIALLLYALAKWPANKETILVFIAVQVPFLACVFYGGMSLTRGWAAFDVLIAMGLSAALAAEIVLLRPWSGEPRPVAPFVLAATLGLVPILRWHARRRWLTLDWRVARLLQLPLRG